MKRPELEIARELTRSFDDLWKRATPAPDVPPGPSDVRAARERSSPSLAELGEVLDGLRAIAVDLGQLRETDLGALGDYARQWFALSIELEERMADRGWLQPLPPGPRCEVCGHVVNHLKLCGFGEGGCCCTIGVADCSVHVDEWIFFIGKVDAGEQRHGVLLREQGPAPRAFRWLS